jgi:hypothetical protein
MKQMLSFEFLSTATFPLVAYQAYVDIDDVTGKTIEASVLEVPVVEFSLAPGASVKTIVVRKPGSHYRTSGENYHVTPESAREEIADILAKAADNPTYAILKQQRDEARALLQKLASELRGMGYDDPNARASSSDAVEFLCQHFDAIDSYLPREDGAGR